ncbi:DNA integrity scanning protein DisA nucleotide-binding domain protein [[Eubacterium] cellulosolvens]
MDLVEDLDLYDELGMYQGTVKRVLSIALDIIRDGMEGKKIGTMFVIGDSKKVLEKSQPLILDLFDRQKVEVRSIHNSKTRETIKKLAYLDGAFIISEDGMVVSAARYINPKTFGKVKFGVGTRHVTGSAITAETKSVAIIVSSSGTIRIYANGGLVREYQMEIKLRNYNNKIMNGSFDKTGNRDLPVFSRDSIHYIYPEPNSNNGSNEGQKGTKSIIDIKNDAIDIMYEKNNKSVGYSFISHLKALKHWKKV